MKVLDTNYLVRFFTGDVESQAERARRVIEKGGVYIPGVVLVETVYILERHYEAKKEDVCGRLKELLRGGGVEGVEYGELALEIYEQEKISFYDSLIVGEAVEKGEELVSFDEEMIEVWKKWK